MAPDRGTPAVCGRSTLASLPSRVGTTLKRKFWDSNEVASSTAGRLPQQHDVDGSLDFGLEG